MAQLKPLAYTIKVDGNLGDWAETPASITFRSKGLDPAELEVSAIQANDQNNLYLRIDTKGTPSQAVDAGSLNRWIYAYINTDNNNTGLRVYGGADYYISGLFSSNPREHSYASAYRYVGTREDWSFDYSGGGAADFAGVLELSMPLKALNLGQSDVISIYFPSRLWYLYDQAPRPTNWLTYPLATVGGPSAFSIIGLFGSETIFLAVVAALMVLEAALIVLFMRRGMGQVPPPPLP